MSVLIDSDVDEFTFLSGGARDAMFMSTACEIRRLQAVHAGRIRHTETSCGFVDDAFHSVASWLQAVTNTSRGTAAFRVSVARMLGTMPVLREAVTAGAVNDDQLRLLARLFNNDRADHSWLIPMNC